ncbi:hypothetical protein HDU83_000785 [Entophlyctis luteolus]|nr:hypothetical protein HDU83_000785 [Entophlyctis luteolus]
MLTAVAPKKTAPAPQPAKPATNEQVNPELLGDDSDDEEEYDYDEYVDDEDDADVVYTNSGLERLPYWIIPGSDGHKITVWKYDLSEKKEIWISNGYCHTLDDSPKAMKFAAISHVWPKSDKKDGSDDYMVENFEFEDVEPGIGMSSQDLKAVIEKMNAKKGCELRPWQLNRIARIKQIMTFVSEKDKLDWFWLDMISVDQTNDFVIRDATYVMSYVYHTAALTVVLHSTTNGTDFNEWESRVWTIQEKWLSRKFRHVWWHADSTENSSTKATQYRLKSVAGDDEILVSETAIVDDSEGVEGDPQAPPVGYSTEFKRQDIVKTKLITFATRLAPPVKPPTALKDLLCESFSRDCNPNFIQDRVYSLRVFNAAVNEKPVVYTKDLDTLLMECAVESATNKEKPDLSMITRARGMDKPGMSLIFDLEQFKTLTSEEKENLMDEDPLYGIIGLIPKVGVMFEGVVPVQLDDNSIARLCRTNVGTSKSVFGNMTGRFVLTFDSLDALFAEANKDDPDTETAAVPNTESNPDPPEADADGEVSPDNAEEQNEDQQVPQSSNDELQGMGEDDTEQQDTVDYYGQKDYDFGQDADNNEQDYDDDVNAEGQDVDVDVDNNEQDYDDDVNADEDEGEIEGNLEAEAQEAPQAFEQTNEEVEEVKDDSNVEQQNETAAPENDLANASASELFARAVNLEEKNDQLEAANAALAAAETEQNKNLWNEINQFIKTTERADAMDIIGQTPIYIQRKGIAPCSLIYGLLYTPMEPLVDISIYEAGTDRVSRFIANSVVLFNHFVPSAVRQLVLGNPTTLASLLTIVRDSVDDKSSMHTNSKTALEMYALALVVRYHAIGCDCVCCSVLDYVGRALDGYNEALDPVTRSSFISMLSKAGEVGGFQNVSQDDLVFSNAWTDEDDEQNAAGSSAEASKAKLDTGCFNALAIFKYIVYNYVTVEVDGIKDIVPALGDIYKRCPEVAGMLLFASRVFGDTPVLKHELFHTDPKTTWNYFAPLMTRSGAKVLARLNDANLCISEPFDTSKFSVLQVEPQAEGKSYPMFGKTKIYKNARSTAGNRICAQIPMSFLEKISVVTEVPAKFLRSEKGLMETTTYIVG